MNAGSPALAFGIDDLKDLIREQEPTSVAQVIAALPQEYKENYTLAYHSQSLQGSDHDNPRAILFGRTAQFILTFNGDPSQQYYSVIETVQFRETSESFELYSVDFSGGTAEVSSPNPQICMSCHGSPPHVIWSSYEYGERKTGHWPGLYGSSHDAPVLNPGELAAFKRFRERAATHPRYHYLVMSKPGAPWFPYGTGPNQHWLRPNDRLGNLLARWQARQIAALIDRGDFIKRHPRTAQAFLLQCPGIEAEPYRRRVRALFDARFPQRSHSLAHELLGTLTPEQQTAFMMHKLLVGSDTFGWDMNIAESESNGQFSTGIVNIDQLVGARWLATLDEGNGLKAYYKPWKSRELYNTFAPQYYERNVAPGGVGQEYDRVMAYFDETHAHLACPGLMRQALTSAAK